MKSDTVLFVSLFACASVGEAATFPFRSAGNGIAIGIEYAHYDNAKLIQGQADAFAEAGLTAMKPIPLGFEWGKMQSGPGEPLFWDDLDLAILTLQDRGFTEILIALKSKNSWAQKSWDNPTPKLDYEDEYRNLPHLAMLDEEDL